VSKSGTSHLQMSSTSLHAMRFLTTFRRFSNK
jgi:hypothetical protein